ncbi:MAG: SUMF1/EgtB/PvdO family nonheme iron enzyme [Proteobacteria bacterium]|nr:SUMF1/EgtB/PvdO family nonheme iron enzyme [Burkholderiales bacterium]
MALARELADEGIACVLDPELVEGDPFWRDAVEASLAECELMVGVVSENALASPWVEQEQRAYTGRKLWLARAGWNRGGETLHPRRDCPLPLGEATQIIRDALPAHSRRRRKRAGMAAPLQSEARVARVRETAAKLETFRASVSRLPRLRLDFDGDRASIGEGFLELRRIATPRAPSAWIGTQPVSNAQYRAFLALTDYPPPPTWSRTVFCTDDAPVTGVNWYEACAFALWMRGSLPSETEWVQAARGAEPRRVYATATGELDVRLACYGQPFADAVPAPATAHPPNAEGFHGMCGNTWDWCASPWHSHRAIRGGGAMDAPRFCAIGSRYRNAPIDRDCCVGFRVKIDAVSPMK